MGQIDKKLKDILQKLMSSNEESMDDGSKLKRIHSVTTQVNIDKEFPLPTLIEVDVRLTLESLCYLINSDEIYQIMKEVSFKTDEYGKLEMFVYNETCNAITQYAENIFLCGVIHSIECFKNDMKPGKLINTIGQMCLFATDYNFAEKAISTSLFGIIPQFTLASDFGSSNDGEILPDDFEIWNYEPKLKYTYGG